MNERMYLNHLQVEKNMGEGYIEVPGYGEVTIKIFNKDTKGYFLVVIPELAWSCNLNNYRDFDKSNEEQLYIGVFHTVGDLEFAIPGIEVCSENLKLVISYIIGLMVKKHGKINDYFKEFNNIHIDHCEQKLRKENVLPTQWMIGAEEYELSNM